MKSSHILKIISNEQLNATTFSMTFDASWINAPQAGQFFSLLCGGDAYLRRPISVCDYDAKARTLRLVYEVRGKGTKLLSEMREGDGVDALGSLGHGFTVKSGIRAAIVGGGIGSFPLLYLAKELTRAGSTVDAYLGFREKKLLLMTDEFSSVSGLNPHIATDDGSFGYHGFSPSELREKIAGGEKYDMIYTCGPSPMMRAVAKVAAEFGVECEVSLEERMGCGVGACLVCACKMNGDDGQTRMKHVCKDGPVINASRWTEANV